MAATVLGTATPAAADDTYPAYLRDPPIDSVVDPWRFFNRECTSWVAHRLNRDGIQFSNGMPGPSGRTGHFGYAENWARNAAEIGFTVDYIPAVGAIAHWGPREGGFGGGAGSDGHVAYVERINPDGTQLVSEYNWPSGGRYGERVVRAPRFIHVSGSAPPPPPAAAAPPPPAAAPAQRSIGSGQTVSGAIGSGARDRWTFTGTAGQRVRIEMSGFDTYLYLLNPGGATIASDDDSLGNLGSLIEVTLPQSGSYTILAAGYGSSSGSYRLSLSVGSSPPPPPPAAVAPPPPPAAAAPPPPAAAPAAPASTSGSYSTTATVNLRSGPGTNYSIVGSMSSGTRISISCQTRSSSSVNGSTIWDRLTDGRWVSDYFTSTPRVNDFSPGLARC